MVKGLKCPFCKSDRLWKAGASYDKDGKNQRYTCKDCHRFTIRPIGDAAAIQASQGK